MIRRANIVLAVIPVEVLLVFAGAAHAQTSRGTITGTVLDSSGAVIRGAQVTVTGVETGVRLSTKSNEAGVYRFDAVDLEIRLSVSGHGDQVQQIGGARHAVALRAVRQQRRRQYGRRSVPRRGEQRRHRCDERSGDAQCRRGA